MIEEAVSAHEYSQVMTFLAELAHSSNRKKRQRFADIFVRFESFSIYGELEPPTEINDLRGNIREIKTAEDRILFFELAATGRHRRTIRLTNGCEKRVSKTQHGKLPRKHLELAEAIERIDRDHGTD